MRIDGPQITGSFNLNGDTVADLDIFTTTSSFNMMTASMATTGSNLFKGDQTLSGSIIPAVNNVYDLGSPTNQFRHVYISSGSLYVNGTKVLGSTAQELQITTDAGQSFKILESSSDTITLQSADGNVTLTSTGQGDIVMDPNTGVIGLKGTVTIYTGNKITSSDGNAIQFGNGIAITGSIVATGTALVSGSSQITYSGLSGVPSDIISGSGQLITLGIATTGSNTFNGNLTVTGFIDTQELRTTYISSSILYRSGSTKFGDELTDTHSFTGSVLISGSLSVPGSNLVSGSSQILNGSGVWSGSAQLPSGIVSSSAQTIANLPSGVVSGSAQTIANLPSGTVSGSVQVDVMSTTNISRLATTGSNVFKSNQIISGSVTIAASTTTNTFNISQPGSSTTEFHLSHFSDGTYISNNYYYAGGHQYTDNTKGSSNILLDVGGIYLRASGPNTQPANIMFISGSGLVGIGTVTPSANLHISSTPGQNNPSIRLTDSAASGNGGNTYISSDKIGVGYNNLTMIAFSYTFKGGASASNYVTIDTSGNFGVGTTIPTQKIEVKGNIRLDSRSKSDSGEIDSITFTKDRPDASTGTYEMGAIRSFTYGGYAGGLTFYSGRHTGNGNYGLIPIVTIGSTSDIGTTNMGIGTTSPSHKLHIYDNSTSGVRGLRIATDSTTVGPTIRMDYAPGGLRNWLIGTSYEYSNDFEIRVSNANSGDPGADGSARFILWADGGYSNAARSIGSLSSTSLGVFSSANVQRWTFSSLCNNTYRTLVASVNGIHGILKIAGTDAGNKNYGEYYVTFSFPNYGVMNFVQLHYSGGGWNTGGFELTYSNTAGDYFLQFRSTSYYSAGNTANYTMEFTAL